MLRDFCEQQGLIYVECGKVLVALDEDEQGRLHGIAVRAKANGVPGVRHLDRGELRELEPHVSGVAGLHSPSSPATSPRPASCRFAASTLRCARTSATP